MTLRFPVTAEDYRARARRRLPRFLFDYLEGGATDEQTLRANASDWHHLTLRQRVLVDVDQVDTSSQLLGETCAMPLVLAPIGLAGMMARRGEVQAARSAEKNDNRDNDK
jgi:L-lactate dehydrogenase (cytochrome)